MTVPNRDSGHRLISFLAEWWLGPEELDALGVIADMTQERGDGALTWLGKLKGDRSDLHSIRINQQRRIRFHWTPAVPKRLKSLTTNEDKIRTSTATLPPIHPGEVLQQEFLGSLSVSDVELVGKFASAGWNTAVRA